MKRILCLMFAAVCLSVLPAASRAADETGDSAVWLLKKSTLVHRDGMHNVLLRALRQLRAANPGVVYFCDPVLAFRLFMKFLCFQLRFAGC